MKKYLVVLTAVMVVASVIAGCSSKSEKQVATEMAESTTKAAETSVMSETQKQGETITAEIDIKDYGVITLELDSSQAPVSVANFVKLAEKGFYDGLTFHRIISGFMIQGGDPEGTGMGGSDETIKGEFSENGVDNTISHTRGTISMARSQDNDSGSSQFFIVHEDSTYLDGSYAGFGHVTEGMDIVDKICEDVAVTDGNGTVQAENQPVINSIKIIK